jgi:hypothetical protein
MPPVPIMPLYPVLARAYIPYQVYKRQFDLREALEKGTLYPELYRPFEKKVKTYSEKVEGGLEDETI